MGGARTATDVRHLSRTRKSVEPLHIWSLSFSSSYTRWEVVVPRGGGEASGTAPWQGLPTVARPPSGVVVSHRLSVCGGDGEKGSDSGREIGVSSSVGVGVVGDGYFDQP